MTDQKPKLVLILGSGFSAQFGLPTTKDLEAQMLTSPSNGVLTTETEQSITTILTRFWSDIFGYRSGEVRPSLEDHFTMLDLSANSGHNLGTTYSPRKLRAIRRMSIHRIFQILDRSTLKNPILRQGLTNALSKSSDVSAITTNWDIIADRSFQQGINYGIPVTSLDPYGNTNGYTRLLKLHGSSNWVYCDCCRRIYCGTEKSALHNLVLISATDFEALDCSLDPRDIEKLKSVDARCSFCEAPFSTRIATFSYRKDFSISQFQNIWEIAGNALSEADRWLFIGYSLPEADFEFRHLLKRSQLARRSPETLRIEVVLRSDEAAVERYHKFLGSQDCLISNTGLLDWINNNFTQEELTVHF